MKTFYKLLLLWLVFLACRHENKNETTQSPDPIKSGEIQTNPLNDDADKNKTSEPADSIYSIHFQKDSLSISFLLTFMDKLIENDSGEIFENSTLEIVDEKLYHIPHKNIDFFSFILNEIPYSGAVLDSTAMAVLSADESFYLLKKYKFQPKNDTMFLSVYGKKIYLNPIDEIRLQIDSIYKNIVNVDNSKKLFCVYKNKNWHKCKEDSVNFWRVKNRTISPKIPVHFLDSEQQNALLQAAYHTLDSLQGKIFPEYRQKEQEPSLEFLFKNAWQLTDSVYMVRGIGLKGFEQIYLDFLFEGQKIIKIFTHTRYETYFDARIIENDKEIIKLIEGTFSEVKDDDYDGQPDRVQKGRIYILIKDNQVIKFKRIVKSSSEDNLN